MTDLEKCDAVFDARSDNLLQFIDRISNDLGATSAILRDRSEKYNSGWFDTRADDRFWFAYGQLYGYYGVLSGARADFRDVIVQRGLASLWTMLEDQFRAALKIQPFIVSNGSESGWLMPAHLATMGFYVLRVRSIWLKYGSCWIAIVSDLNLWLVSVVATRKPLGAGRRLAINVRFRSGHDFMRMSAFDPKRTSGVFAPPYAQRAILKLVRVPR